MHAASAMLWGAAWDKQAEGGQPVHVQCRSSRCLRHVWAGATDLRRAWAGFFRRQRRIRFPSLRSATSGCRRRSSGQETSETIATALGRVGRQSSDPTWCRSLCRDRWQLCGSDCRASTALRASGRFRRPALLRSSLWRVERGAGGWRSGRGTASLQHSGCGPRAGSASASLPWSTGQRAHASHAPAHASGKSRSRWHSACCRARTSSVVLATTAALPWPSNQSRVGPS